MEDEDGVRNLTAPQRSISDVFKIWITPELIARAERGEITLPIVLTCAQIIFRRDEKPMVRINSEIRARFFGRVTRAVNANDPVAWNEDLSSIEGVELEDDEADCGHITLVRHRDKWVMLFDARQNQAHARNLISRAAEFSEGAEFYLAKGYRGPYADNLFAACELLAKARLITSAMEPPLTHGAIHSKINAQRKWGNVDGRFVDLFNDLSRVRPQARYEGLTHFELRAGDNALAVVREEIVELRVRLQTASERLLPTRQAPL